MIKRAWFKNVPGFGEGATFLRKWGLLGLLIGVSTGAGALALIWLISLISHYLLETIVGYSPPQPSGEGGLGEYTFHMTRPWLLPLVTSAAGLLGGFLVWKIAPETAGIGTNAAIRAFHNNDKLKAKTAILKLFTSALTIGSGLTSGREGPIAQ